MNQKSGMFLWKFFGFFTVSYLILSIPFNNRPLFDYSYDITSSATKPVYAAIKIGVVEGWEATERFTKRLFSNSVPTETAYIDSVGSKAAAPEREPSAATGSASESSDMNADPITEQEKASVEKALQD